MKYSNTSSIVTNSPALLIAIFSSPLAQGLFHKAIVQSGLVSHSSIQAAENYLLGDGIAGTISSKEVINQILLSSNKAPDLELARETQQDMQSEEIRSFLREQSPQSLLSA